MTKFINGNRPVVSADPVQTPLSFTVKGKATADAPAESAPAAKTPPATKKAAAKKPVATPRRKKPA